MFSIRTRGDWLATRALVRSDETDGMAILDEVYRRSPVFVQSAMVAGFGAGWYFRRFGRTYREKVAQLERDERSTRPQFALKQLDSLNAILERARGAPYYARAFASAPMRLETLDDLRHFPTLTKQTLRTSSKELLTETPPRGTKVFRSSGTTGTPTDLYYTRDFHQEGQAYFQARCRQWAGVAHRDRRAMFGVRKVCNFEQSRPPFWRSSPVESLTYYSIYHLSPQHLPSYITHLAEWKPKLIMGYPSALNLVAKHLLDHGQRLEIPAAITTSETVTPEIRATIEEAFQGTLFDQYGAVEGTHFASQCEFGSYHVSPERGIVEVLDGDGPCELGREGRVVVTGLENHLQPLIRYEIGDVAYWAEDQHCKCGRDMPILGGVQGRYEDYCTTLDGRRMLRFDTVFKGISSLVEAQVVQDAVDAFTINLVPTSRFSAEDRTRLRSNFREHAGDVRLTLVELDAIPRTANGKFRAVINRTLRK